MKKQIDIEKIKAEYERVGNVWKVADSLGIAGQTVHRRLVAAGVDTSMNVFTEKDKKRLLRDYDKYRKEKRLADLAKELGRTKPFVCRQAAKLGLTANKKRDYYELDVTGKRYGRLTAVRDTGKRDHGSKVWLFLCDCGNEIEIPAHRAASSKTLSCGCLQRERTGEASMTHGLSKSRIYKTYNNMKRRCYYKRSRDYKWYGEKGVAVCDEWLRSFEDFYEWAVSNGYEEHLTIDRIDSDGDYCPENCQWITHSENVRRANKKKRKNEITS